MKILSVKAIGILSVLDGTNTTNINISYFGINVNGLYGIFLHFLSSFFVRFYNKIFTDIMQYSVRDTASITVVINGLATAAGSSLKAFAKRGRVHPTDFAIITVIKRVSDTVKHIAVVNG